MAHGARLRAWTCGTPWSKAAKLLAIAGVMI
jgi:hypothetical protein